MDLTLSMAKNTRPVTPPNKGMTTTFLIVTTLSQVINSVLKWGTIAFVAWCAKVSMVSLGGKQTDANFAIKFLADIRFHEAVAYTVGIGGAVYGYRQKRLRQRKIAELGPRVTKVEKNIDPKRTSSGLTAEGKTKEGDEYV
jgi:hypothetical protein